MNVRGIEGLTVSELVNEVKAGGRFVVFRACIGFVVGAAVLPSAICFVRKGQRAHGGAWWRTTMTALLGWWALTGPGRALACIRENLRGGVDVTAAVLRGLADAEARGLGLTDFPVAPFSPARAHAA